MSLSSDLISKFVEITNDKPESKKETIVYGTIVLNDGSKYVKMDGSDLLTPISSTTDVEDGERVTVMIKDHSAIVTGNISSPSARTSTVQALEGRVTTAETLIADKASIKDLESETARIDTLTADNVTIKERLSASEADIDNLEAENVTINQTLTAQNANIETLNTTKLSVQDATATYATINNLNATNAEIHNLEADYGDFVELTTNNFSSVNANITNLEAKKIDTVTANATYANIDFSNIGTAAIEKFFAKSGLIENVIVGDGTVTGNLVGVTIKGDLIEGGTVVADKLVIQGEDGLYYKLNTNGATTSTEQTEYNSLNGSIITAKSITATQISVKDLVAFDATIGGFKITDNSIYSGVKESVNNTTSGIYMDNDGQIAFGDSKNYIKLYKDTDGVYKLTISAQNINIGTNGKNVEEAITEVKNTVDNVKSDSDANAIRVSDAQLAIDSLKTTISTLVTGQNGESLMTQTENGWTFSMASVLNNLNSANQSIANFENNLSIANNAIDILNGNVSDLSEYTNYIKFSVDEGAPCIILGETDSNFKVVITNTNIRFMEGSSIPAYISNQALNIGDAVINGELRQGGFAWVARSNGNYGLVWKGV